MMTTMKFFFTRMVLAAALCGTATVAFAQGIDLERAEVIKRYSKKSQKSINAQNAALAFIGTQQMWLEKEFGETVSALEELNNYLTDSLKLINTAAEIYGLYYEVTALSKNMGVLSKIVSDSPTNILAVAFSTKKNGIYRNITMKSIEIVGDVRTLCFGKAKMTEKERNELMSGIRPKLKNINRQLRCLALTIKYTTLLDVWREITDRYDSYTPMTRGDIVNRSFRDWKDCMHKNKVNN